MASKALKKLYLIFALLLPAILNFVLLKFTKDAVLTLIVTIPVCFYLSTYVFEKVIEDFSWEMALIKEIMGWK